MQHLMREHHRTIKQMVLAVAGLALILLVASGLLECRREFLPAILLPVHRLDTFGLSNISESDLVFITGASFDSALVNRTRLTGHYFTTVRQH